MQAFAKVFDSSLLFNRQTVSCYCYLELVVHFFRGWWLECDERSHLLKSPANKKMEGNKKQAVSTAQMLKGLRRGYLNEA